MLDEAIALAAEKFKGVFDKGGRPYILHCLWVMDRVRHLGDEVMQIAILHDIVEDTDVTLDDLAEMGYTERVITGVDFMTKRDEETYQGFIERVVENNDATQVKLRDIEHNSKITRLKFVDERAIHMARKYHKAYLRLKPYRK